MEGIEGYDYGYPLQPQWVKFGCIPVEKDEDFYKRHKDFAETARKLGDTMRQFGAKQVERARITRVLTGRMSNTYTYWQNGKEITKTI